MKTVWMVVFITSLVLLLAVFIRQRITLSMIKRFGLHLVAAALVLYLFNFSGLISDLYIPLNPMTIATVVILGVPGIFLILGLQWVVL
ncbi:pro-sigmaK processing inhibitor BofA family protein [Paenibacillus tarimensis]